MACDVAAFAARFHPKQRNAFWVILAERSGHFHVNWQRLAVCVLRRPRLQHPYGHTQSAVACDLRVLFGPPFQRLLLVPCD